MFRWFLLLPVLFTCVRCSAEQRIYGGGFVNLTQSQVAYITEGTFSCSGVLVGPQLVLTAAHCVADPGPNGNYAVVVGGDVYTIANRYFSSLYDPASAPVVSAPADLGMLILSRPVTNVHPLGILYNDYVVTGERLTIYGYGENETSGKGENPLSNGKYGTIIVTGTEGGTLSSSFDASGASSCHGDSGGPAVQNLNDHLVVVGISSIGVNLDVGGSCVLNGDGAFRYVDLQSPLAQGFLAAFDSVYRISGLHIYLEELSKYIVAQLSLITSTRSAISRARKIVALRKEAKKAVSFADGNRFTLMQGIVRSLSGPDIQNPGAIQKKKLRRARLLATQLNALGVD